jgi:ferric-dicitrate binding protein FerR (iron transport regulator)
MFVLKTLLIKYLTETITEAERQQLTEWLQTPKNQKTFKEFVKINHRLNKNATHIDLEAAYERLMASVNISQKEAPVKKLTPTWLKYAAVFVGVAALGFGIYYNSPKTNVPAATPQITLQLEDGSIRILDENSAAPIVDAQGNIISEQNRNALVYSQKSAPKTLQYNTLKVPYGKTFHLALSDGSQVVLNAGTQLKYPVAFVEGENRTVFLDGEAFFEVAKDAAHPFTVATEQMDIEVLGTKFNVTSYNEDRNNYTVLVEGKVAAHSKISEEEKVLSPNEKVFFENGSLQVQPTNVAKFIAWVQGQLVFVDDSFGVIKNKLERKYNVKIINNYAELANITITATFTNETIDEVLKTFQTYKDFTYTYKNGTVTINKPKK